MRSLAILILLAAGPATAQEAMSGAAFDAYATGKTLSYGVGTSQPYGTERYLPNRRVIWTTRGGRCTTGVWFDWEDQICFRYDDDPEDKCWHFFPDGDALTGFFQQDFSLASRIAVIDDAELYACDRLTS